MMIAAAVAGIYFFIDSVGRKIYHGSIELYDSGKALLETESEPASDSVSAVLAEILAGEKANPYDAVGDTAPDGGCVPLMTRVPRVHLSKLFNELNDEHLSVANRDGQKPITDEASAWRNCRGIELVESDSTFFIDELTHSYPYLRPHAAALLREIGHRFRDSLRARGGGEYRLKVTSLLRTDAKVRKLRRVNRNAVSESAHCYGTTFDISYSKFICDNSNGTRRSFENLKNLLAEIVNDLHEEGRCLVKYEYRQACLHITAKKVKE